MPCFEAHHKTTTEHLVLCHGARFDVTLNGYLEKPKPSKPKPKPSIDKPKFCGECDYFRGLDYCRLNATYGITGDTKACDRALPIEDKKKRKIYWEL